jgi:hypothetical protein
MAVRDSHADVTTTSRRVTDKTGTKRIELHRLYSSAGLDPAGPPPEPPTARTLTSVAATRLAAASVGSCSQTRTTIQLAASSSAPVAASRARLPAIFASQ